MNILFYSTRLNIYIFYYKYCLFNCGFALFVIEHMVYISLLLQINNKGQG